MGETGPSTHRGPGRIAIVAVMLAACGATSPVTTDSVPKTVADAGVAQVQTLSQIDTLDDGWWIDGFGDLEQGRTYVSLGEPPERTPGESDRCPVASWIDEREDLEGVIDFESSGSLTTTFDIFAAYETDYLLAMPTCMHIEGTYVGVSGDVADSSGTYTIVWGTGDVDRSITFDGG